MLEELQKSMTVIGLSPHIQGETFATLSAILRLGNVQFTQVRATNGLLPPRDCQSAGCFRPTLGEDVASVKIKQQY